MLIPPATKGDLCPGGLCLGGGSLSRGVSVRETPHRRTVTCGRYASYCILAMNELTKIFLSLHSLCNLDRILYSVEFPSVLK